MEKKKKIKLLKLAALFFVLFVAFGAGMYFMSQPKLNSVSHSFFERHSENDSLMINNRHYGYVNFDKFIELAASARNSNFNKESDVVVEDDSVRITVRNKTLFYGIDDGGFWTKKFTNSPIRITGRGFKAAIVTRDSVRYIFMPYQILTSVANYVGDTENRANRESHSDSTRQTLRIDDRESLNQRLSSSTGKIQTGGYVFQNMCDILKDRQDLQANKRGQLEEVWKYARSHWYYIHDPYDTHDTWRSATETIQTYYNIDGKQYYGDCDDFAILMASFAKQVGFRSRVVTAYNSQGEGHAYSQFLDENGRWVSMDWFSNRFGGKPFEGRIDHIYENI